VTAYADKEIAAVAWAANAELQALHGDPVPSVPGDLGDAEAHEVTIAGIRAILGGATPEQLHETWVQSREAQGWTHGPRKDSRLRIHPALVPYGELPECQRVKDRVFAAIVRAMTGQDAPELAAVYRERARLVAFLAACYPSVLVHGDDPETGDWPVIFVDTPAGQLTWHLAESDLGLFAHVRAVHVAESGGRPKWDGHTTEEKYERLAELIPHELDRSDAPSAPAADGVHALAMRVQQAWNAAFAHAPDSVLDYRMARLAVEIVFAAPENDRIAAQELQPAPGTTGRKLEIAMAALRQIDQDGDNARATAEEALSDIADVHLSELGGTWPDRGAAENAP
jgi:RyR domain